MTLPSHEDVQRLSDAIDGELQAEARPIWLVGNRGMGRDNFRRELLRARLVLTESIHRREQLVDEIDAMLPEETRLMTDNERKVLALELLNEFTTCEHMGDVGRAVKEGLAVAGFTGQETDGLTDEDGDLRYEWFEERSKFYQSKGGPTEAS